MDVRDRIEQWSRRPRVERLARLAATPAELTAKLSGVSAAVLARRPAPAAWAPVEVICHLRDLEESFHERLDLILTSDEPCFPTTNPNRWAEERQYARNDAHAAARAFGRRREQTLQLLHDVRGDDWSRAGRQLDSRGRRTVDDFVTLMAWHDDNHLEQLSRALDGRE